MSEADARIKIDAALRRAGWRLPGDNSPNVRTEISVREGGETRRPDYILEDERRFALAIVEAKSAEHDPLEGKEQVRKYAEQWKARFALLSNSELHYFWDLRADDPTPVVCCRVRNRWRCGRKRIFRRKISWRRM